MHNDIYSISTDCSSQRITFARNASVIRSREGEHQQLDAGARLARKVDKRTREEFSQQNGISKDLAASGQGSRPKSIDAEEATSFNTGLFVQGLPGTTHMKGFCAPIILKIYLFCFVYNFVP